jgi:hypothetical protein
MRYRFPGSNPGISTIFYAFMRLEQKFYIKQDADSNSKYNQTNESLIQCSIVILT